MVGFYISPGYGFLAPSVSGFIKDGQNNIRIEAYIDGFLLPTALNGNNDSGKMVGIVTPKR